MEKANKQDLPDSMQFLVRKPTNGDLSPLVLGAKLGRGFGDAKGKTLREIYLEALQADTLGEATAKFDLAEKVLEKIKKGAQHR